MALAGLTRAAEPQKAFPFAYDLHDFPNGLRLITVPTDFPNVVALYIVVQTGSRNEVEAGKSGFAHLFEHMMFRGTKAYPPARWEAVMKEAGAATNAYTSDDHTAYHATFSKEDLPLILEMEADRLQNLEYAPDALKTESLAVLGEYNKSSADPELKIHETLRETAFERHTYRHTTLGYLADIENMPNQYAYSRQFFDRYYRPEYTTILVVGDVVAADVLRQVGKHWSGWKRGSFRPEIPAEPAPTGARRRQLEWPSPTLPWVWVAHRTPAYTDTARDSAALDILSFLGFSESSPLYKKLVLEDQTVDLLAVDAPDHVDPYLFTVTARVKEPKDMAAVEEQILSTLKGFHDTPVAADRLEAVKRHLRYSFALGLDNSEAIAEALARYVALRRTPETINRIYELYSQVTAEDVRDVARRFLVETGRTIVTLTAGGAR